MLTLAENLISVIIGVPEKNATRGMYRSHGGSYSPPKHRGISAAISSVVQTGYIRDDHCPSLQVLIRTSGLIMNIFGKDVTPYSQGPALSP